MYFSFAFYFDLFFLIRLEGGLPAVDFIQLDEHTQMVCLIAKVVFFGAVGVLENLFIIKITIFSTHQIVSIIVRISALNRF